MKFATVNVRFKFPVEYDDVGRRIPPVNTAVKYMEPTLVELARVKHAGQFDYHYDEKTNETFVKVGQLAQQHFSKKIQGFLNEHNDHIARVNAQSEIESDARIMRTYGLTRGQFRSISYYEIHGLRKKFQVTSNDTIGVELPPDEKDRLYREWLAERDLDYLNHLGVTRSVFNSLEGLKQHELMKEKKVNWGVVKHEYRDKLFIAWNYDKNQSM
jgi:desulfoferrodoxin (superoxide reductase-like protein)